MAFRSLISLEREIITDCIFLGFNIAWVCGHVYDKILWYNKYTHKGIRRIVLRVIWLRVTRGAKRLAFSHGLYCARVQRLCYTYKDWKKKKKKEKKRRKRKNRARRIACSLVSSFLYHLILTVHCRYF